jgi:hypothetical protein
MTQQCHDKPETDKAAYMYASFVHSFIQPHPLIHTSCHYQPRQRAHSCQAEGRTGLPATSYQHDVLKAGAAKNPLKHTNCLRTNTGVCSNKWCICGVNKQRRERRGGRATSSTSRPTGLAGCGSLSILSCLSTPRSSARRTARAPSSSSSGGSSSAPRLLAYYLDDLAQQKITQGMQAMPFV